LTQNKALSQQWYKNFDNDWVDGWVEMSNKDVELAPHLDYTSVIFGITFVGGSNSVKLVEI